MAVRFQVQDDIGGTQEWFDFGLSCLHSFDFFVLFLSDYNFKHSTEQVLSESAVYWTQDSRSLGHSPNFRRSTEFFHLSLMSALGDTILSYSTRPAFIMLKYVPSMCSFFRASFIIKAIELCQRHFLSLLEWIGVCPWVYLCTHCIYWFVYVEPSLSAWGEATSWVTSSDPNMSLKLRISPLNHWLQIDTKRWHVCSLPIITHPRIPTMYPLNVQYIPGLLCFLWRTLEWEVPSFSHNLHASRRSL